MPASLEFRNGN